MADQMAKSPRISRRRLMIGGGAGVGLVVAWWLWPRRYLPNLPVGEDETLFSAWLKIAETGQVTVAVPQAELGQGGYTALPQILADELGADWRTVGVEPAPLHPLYANPDGAQALFGTKPARHADVALMLTAGSTSVRAFEAPLREAGAAARVMLCKAAAARWGGDWESCATADGFVMRDGQRLRFAELAAEAAEHRVPEALPLRSEGPRLTGQSLPRLDTPAKVDGTANFAADIRLPGMVFAAIRQGPIGDTRLVRINRAAAERLRGVVGVVEQPGWVAAVAESWWAANRALDTLAPRFETRGGIVNSDSIAAALRTAIAGEGTRMASMGDLAATFRGASIVSAEYLAAPGLHAAIEPMSATAVWRDGRPTVWMPSQAPALARAAIARACAVDADTVTLHVTMAGGSFGAKLEPDVGVQAALIARAVDKPVQLTWSRSEDCLHDRYRPPALARLSARVQPGGSVTGWLAKIAAPSIGRELEARLNGGEAGWRGSLGRSGDAAAVAGARPLYAIPNLAIDHHPADIGVPVGEWRSGAHAYTCFFNECFVDELAHVANVEAISFRTTMLAAEARMVRCMSVVASLGAWQGGIPGSGQGVATHAAHGSYIAVLAEARPTGGGIKVDRLIAAVDCGRMINPDLVRQQIEGGLIFGMAAAIGGATGFTENLADVRGFAQMRLPTLADMPELSIELIESNADPGGVSTLAVPPVAPAIANALVAATGTRIRRLPLLSESE